jgi:hypothetical protein
LNIQVFLAAKSFQASAWRQYRECPDRAATVLNVTAMTIDYGGDDTRICHFVIFISRILPARAANAGSSEPQQPS